MNIEEYIKQLDEQMKEYDSIYHDAAVKYGLSDTAMWILYCVSDDSAVFTQQDLCRRCYFPKQTVRTCLHKKRVRIFEHNFVADKAKMRRRAVARQEFLTQSAAIRSTAPVSLLPRITI